MTHRRPLPHHRRNLPDLPGAEIFAGSQNAHFASAKSAHKLALSSNSARAVLP